MLKYYKSIVMSAALIAGATSCGTDQQTDGKIIDKTEVDITDGPDVSPDNTKILFGVSYESIEENASNRDLYVMNVDGSEMTRLTRTPKSENNAVWINNGSQIAFMYPNDGKNQVWVMNADGTDRKCVSSVEQGVGGFLISPDEKHIVLIVNVKYSRTAQDVYPDLPKASGRIIDDLMYKHWDEWVTEVPHPFVGDFDGNSVTNVADKIQDDFR